MFGDFCFGLSLNSIRDIINKLICLTCFCLIVSGCSSIKGSPRPVINVNKIVTQHESELSDWIAKPPSTCAQIREATNKTMTLIDMRYAEFIDDINVESKTKTTVTDITLAGLGLAGTAVGGAGAKTILHALSAGIAATNTSIDKNFFYEKALPALASKMNADRKAQKLLIIQRLQGCKEPGDYLWFEAVHDLTEYYAAGTLLGAIASISKDAGASQVRSEGEIKKAIVPFAPSKDTDAKAQLRQILRQGGSKDIMSCWQHVNPDLFQKEGNADHPCAVGTPNPMRLINAAECAEDQPEVLNCIKNP